MAQHRRLRGGVLVVGVLVATTLGVSPSLAAQDTSAARAAAPRATTSASSATKGYGAADVIVCTPNVQHPHKSKHVGGTVNVVVTLTCTKAVPLIKIRAALYRNGHLVKESGVKAVHGRSFAANNAAVRCRSARYRGWMSYFVQFPPGYVPRTGSSSGFGDSVRIRC